jgi:Tetracyclin repressor-like, C-terminal domain
VRSTTALLRGILEDRTKPPLERLRAAVHAFVRSECEEAEMRLALGDAAPFYRDAPEAQEPRASGTRTVQLFIEEVLPQAPEATRGLAGDVIMMTLSAVGKHISEAPRTSAEIETYSTPSPTCCAPTSIVSGFERLTGLRDSDKHAPPSCRIQTGVGFRFVRQTVTQLVHLRRAFFS